MVNFCICIAIGQDLANSEACIHLKLLQEAKIHNLSKNDNVSVVPLIVSSK